MQSYFLQIKCCQAYFKFEPRRVAGKTLSVGKCQAKSEDTLSLSLFFIGFVDS